MSEKYTTGELAKLCGVTVRTVQYYDTRGILVPSQLSEGGRRLYDEADLRRLKVICFLRGLGLSIDAISRLLAEEDPAGVIFLLLDQQEQELRQQRDEMQEKLDRLTGLKRELRGAQDISVESIGDIAKTMSDKQKLKKIHRTMILIGLPISILQWAGIMLLILKGIWWPLVLWAVLALPAVFFMTRWYFRVVAYLCPKCHRVFQPGFREFFFAGHTPYTRRLTCPHCERKGYCVETTAEIEESPRAAG